LDTGDNKTIGRLLRSGISGFVVGCKVTDYGDLQLGALIEAPLVGETNIYGLIYDIHLDDDGLIQQLAATDLEPNILEDTRASRNVPLEISILAVGYKTRGGKILHNLPPRPPESLVSIQACSPAKIRAFTNTARFGYFRHILRNKDIPLEETMAHHIKQAQDAHQDDPGWKDRALQELIILLRDDHLLLTNVLSAVSDIFELREA
jgi:hypothetical protein